MATVYKNLLSNDVANTRTLLHEAIPITGSIVSGTYGYATTAIGSERHIKTYGHGMFESVYDYPYLSSSANQIFDITTGYASTSALSGSSYTQNAKKINIYNQMAQYLVGYDHTGSIKRFKMPTDASEILSCYFVPFSRLLIKDEIKKGSFSLELSVSGTTAFTEDGVGAFFGDRLLITDVSGATGYHVDSPAGEYGVLYATASGPDLGATAPEGLLSSVSQNVQCGLIYYQAGVCVLTGGIFQNNTSAGILNNTTYSLVTQPRISNVGDTSTVGFTLGSTGSTIANMSDGLRNRIYNISFNNTTELNSTIYFCRASHSDFNYSSNPTYLSASAIRVKTRASDTPVAYFTSVGLYSADNELLAVAKLSEPLRKDPTNEVTLRVRLDY
jgi:hypothetical protein